MWSFGSVDRDVPAAVRDAGPSPARCTRCDPEAEACRRSLDAGVCGFHWGGYCFGVADQHARGQAARLIERMYAKRGYRSAAAARRSDSPHRITLGGAHHGRLFATLTLGLDNQDGLLVDGLYHAEVDAFRGSGRRLCELSAFAIDPDYSSHGVLACLFRLAYLYGRMLYQVTDAFIEVNPRHVGFYEHLMHFRRIGQERLCPRVNAPAVLLHLDLACVPATSALQAS